MTWRHHTERTVGNALHIYIRTYSLFESGRLSTTIKLTLHRALIGSVMTYAWPIWEYAANTHPLKLQRLQNRVLCPTGNLDRCTPVHKLHVAFKIPYMYDYITKLSRTQVEVILNHVNHTTYACSSVIPIKTIRTEEESCRVLVPEDSEQKQW
jgi:hypothetical protein